MFSNKQARHVAEVVLCYYTAHIMVSSSCLSFEITEVHELLAGVLFTMSCSMWFRSSLMCLVCAGAVRHVGCWNLFGPITRQLIILCYYSKRTADNNVDYDR